MIISIDFDFFEQCYLKTDEDQKPRLITGIRILPGNLIVYVVSFGTINSEHYREEITIEKDQVKTIT